MIAVGEGLLPAPVVPSCNNDGLGSRLLEFAAEEAVKRSGVPGAAKKARQQRQAMMVAGQQVRRTEIVRDWAAIVDARPCRELRFVNESSCGVTLEFTWASHDSRHEGSLKGGRKSAEVLRLLEVQKEVVTRLLGRTDIDSRHWSALSWLQWPTWLQDKVRSAEGQEAAKLRTHSKAPLASWCDLESDSDSEDYLGDSYDEHYEQYNDHNEIALPEPAGRVAVEEREQFAEVIKSYYKSRFEVCLILVYGSWQIRESRLSHSPIPGFLVRLQVKVPQPAVQRLVPHVMQHALASAFCGDQDDLLVRAAAGLQSAAIVALSSARVGFWPVLHKAICSFLPTPADVGPCFCDLETQWREQAVTRRRRAELVLRNLNEL